MPYHGRCRLLCGRRLVRYGNVYVGSWSSVPALDLQKPRAPSLGRRADRCRLDLRMRAEPWPAYDKARGPRLSLSSRLCRVAVVFSAFIPTEKTCCTPAFFPQPSVVPRRPNAIVAPATTMCFVLTNTQMVWYQTCRVRFSEFPVASGVEVIVISASSSHDRPSTQLQRLSRWAIDSAEHCVR